MHHQAQMDVYGCREAVGHQQVERRAEVAREGVEAGPVFGTGAEAGADVSLERGRHASETWIGARQTGHVELSGLRRFLRSSA